CSREDDYSFDYW
nr:immunoglobulin heavy chain junction region [Mus musculus]MBK4187406.1 immunoglobulin heavy chain junction region [Mus musculus]MBK4187407.1 immunoglobulin heavy chain junction region [Mus musculus]